MKEPGNEPRRQWRLPWPRAADRAKALRQKWPIDFAREAYQGMAKVDDLIQRRAEQIVLTVVARLAHRSLQTSESHVEGITNRQNRES
jgi:hypothetical protein